MTRITHMKAGVRGTVVKRRRPPIDQSTTKDSDNAENRIPSAFGFSWGQPSRPLHEEQPPIPPAPPTTKKKAKKLTDSRTPSLSSLASVKERGRKLKARASQQSLSESQIAPMNKRKRTRRRVEQDTSESESEMGLPKRKHADAE